MPTFEATLKTALGALCSNRCYAVVNDSPTITLPYVTFQVIADQELLLTFPGRDWKRIQVDVWGKTYDEAKALAALAETAVETAFPASSKNMGFDGYEEVSREYRHTLDYYIWP